jgi:hypothetical protein
MTPPEIVVFGLGTCRYLEIGDAYSRRIETAHHMANQPVLA